MKSLSGIQLAFVLVWKVEDRFSPMTGTLLATAKRLGSAGSLASLTAWGSQNSCRSAKGSLREFQESKTEAASLLLT